MSKLEEMVETARRSMNFLPNSATDHIMRTALLAVFDKHVKAMLAEAYDAGFCDGSEDRPGVNTKFHGSVDYAERVISELKGK